MGSGFLFTASPPWAGLTLHTPRASRYSQARPSSRASHRCSLKSPHFRPGSPAWHRHSACLARCSCVLCRQHLWVCAQAPGHRWLLQSPCAGSLFFSKGCPRASETPRNHSSQRSQKITTLRGQSGVSGRGGNGDNHCPTGWEAKPAQAQVSDVCVLPLPFSHMQPACSVIFSTGNFSQ